MSSVLEALRQIEDQAGTAGPVLGASPPSSQANGRGVLVWAAVAIVAIAASGVAVWYARSAWPARESARTPVAAAPAAPAPALPEVPARRAPADDVPAAKAEASVPKPAADVPVVKTAQRPKEAPAAARPRPRAAVAGAAQGGVRLETVSFTEAPSARSATLVVDGAREVLHQGESRGDVSVQLIMRDRVYVEQRGTVFALEAPQ